MTEMNIFIEADGTMKMIYCDEVNVLFAEQDISTRRASHVEPIEGTSKWQADMAPVGGPILGPFTGPTARTDALAAEVDWLRNEMMQRRVDVL